MAEDLSGERLAASRDTTAMPSGHVRQPPPATALPFRVRTFGRMHRTPWHSTLGTYFDDAMLTVVVAGRGTYRLFDRTVAVRGGMLGVVLPEDRPGILAADAADPYDHYYCRFAGGEALVVARRIRKRLGSAFATWREWERLLPVLTEMHHYEPANAATSPHMVELDALLALLLVRIECPFVATPDPTPTRLGLLTYMENAIDAPMDLDRMAAHFGISKGHLCRLARSELGQTVVAVWRDLKLEWARELLRETDMTVDEVSRRVGFNSPFYFSTVFSQHIGISPTSWRRGDASD